MSKTLERTRTRARWSILPGLVALLLLLPGAIGSTVTDFQDGGPLVQRCRIAPGATLADHPDTYPWQDITPDLFWTAPVAVTVGAEDEQPDAFSQMTLTLRNSYSRVAGPMEGLHGRYTTDNAASDLWPDFEQNTPIEHAISTDDGATYDVTARMYVSQATDEWPAKSDEMALTRITADGVFRRMGQWEDLQSAAYRSMIGTTPGDYVPLRYWSMEDGASAASFASSVAGGAPGLFKHVLSIADPGDVAPSGYAGPEGSADLAHLPAGAAVVLPVDPYADTSNWAVQGALVAGDADGFWYVQVNLTSGARVSVQVDAAAGTIIMTSTSASDAFLSVTSDTFDPALVRGSEWGSLVFGANSPGPGVDTLTARLLDRSTGSQIVAVGLVNPGTYSPVSSISISSLGTGDAGMGAGHFGLFVDPAFTVATDGTEGARALGGWLNELPSERAERICRELGIPFEAFGDEDGTNFTMGPQAVGRALDVLRDCESAGRAIMTDHLGLVQFYCLDAAYNQDAILVVDGYERELFLPWSPTTDDLGRANLVTVAQPSGTSATYRDDEDIDGVPGVRPARGVYAKGPITVNLSSALGLYQQAAFEVGRGTQARRYPTMMLDGLRKPEQAIAMIINGRPRAKITMTNLPRASRQGDVDVLLKGWTMTVLGPRRGWTFACNTVVSLPYEVGVYDDGVSRYDLANATLTADRTFGGVSPPTTLGVTTDGSLGALATTTAGEYTGGVDLDVAGCRIRVTAMAGASSPQTATISTVVVNGISKTVAAGTPIFLWDPARYAL